jgi:small-conductance mechanosensitive channel
VVVLLPLLIAVVVVYSYRVEWFGLDLPIRIASVVAVVACGGVLARALGRAAGPVLLQRLEPNSAGTVGFFIRLLASIVVLVVALRLIGIKPETLAAGGAVTALILGLAAQQTLSHVIAGAVILTSGHLKVGDYVRVQNSTLGPIEGSVASIGLLYTTIQSQKDTIMVPNNGLTNAAVVPRTSTHSVCVRAHLSHGIKPSDVARTLSEQGRVRTVGPPSVALAEISAGNVTVTIEAIPARSAERQLLYDDLARTVSKLHHEAEVSPESTSEDGTTF